MTDKNSWGDTPSDSPTPPAKKGMSGCLLASLIVGGLGLVSLLVCCGVGAYFATSWAPKMTTLPAEVAAVGQLVLDMKVPDEFKPSNAMTMDNFVFTMRIVQFTHQEGKGKMVLGTMKIKIGDPNQANPQAAQFRSQHEIEITGNLDVKKTESHEIDINGQKVAVMIGEATDRSTGKEVHTAKADINSPTGQTFFLLRLDDDAWDQDAVLKMLEGAKIP
jgi:hypothetical protein